MTKFDFYLLFTDHIFLCVSILFVCNFFTLLLIRKHIYSIYDPMFFFTILGASSYSVVFITYYFGKISEFYVISFLLTQISFFVGWLLIKPINAIKIKSFDINKSGLWFYIIASITHIASQLIVYYVKGIPLLSVSRLEIFTGGGGFGVFNRLIIITSVLSLSIAIFRVLYDYDRSFIGRLFDNLNILLFIIFSVLSGSKSGLLTFIFIYGLTVFFSKQFYLNRFKEDKFERLVIFIIMLSTPVALMTIYIQNVGVYNDVDIKFIISGLMMRFVNTGDIFFMAWGDNYINSVVKGNDALLALFKDILSATRIFDSSELPEHLGLTIFKTMYNTDVQSGPNARHNVFGLLYFGFFGAPFYSFMLGLLVGIMRNSFYRISKGSYFWMAFYVSTAYFACFIEQDFTSMAMMYIFSLLLIYPLVYLLAYILSKVS